MGGVDYTNSIPYSMTNGWTDRQMDRQGQILMPPDYCHRGHKKIFFFFFFFFGGGGGGGGVLAGGARVSEFFCTKNPNLEKIKKNFW